MPKVLFYVQSLQDVSLAKYAQVVRDVSSQADSSVVIMTEGIAPNLDVSVLGNTEVVCINREVDGGGRHSEETKREVSEKYRNIIPTARLEVINSEGSLFYAREDRFEDLLCSHLIYFEGYLKRSGVTHFCPDLGEAYRSINITLLDAVCKRQKIAVLLAQVPIFRIQVSGNLNRVSSKINNLFLEKKKSGLTENERKKVLNYFDSYYEFKRGEKFNDYIFRKSSFHNKKNLDLKKIKNDLKKKIRFHLSTRLQYLSNPDIYDTFKGDKPFVLFLPNKNNNYRTLKLSPFYSDSSYIVRSLSLSLPLTHSLVIKDHPHSLDNNVDVNMMNEIKRRKNCYYVDPHIDTYDLAKKADIIFCVASSSGFELLSLFKHVVYFGRQPFLFGCLDSPIKRVECVEDLPNIIQDCLGKGPSKDDILAYYYAFLSCTYPAVGEDGEQFNDQWDQMIVNPDTCKIINKTSKVLIDYINNKSDI